MQKQHDSLVGMVQGSLTLFEMPGVAQSGLCTSEQFNKVFIREDKSAREKAPQCYTDHHSAESSVRT